MLCTLQFAAHDFQLLLHSLQIAFEKGFLSKPTKTKAKARLAAPYPGGVDDFMPWEKGANNGDDDDDEEEEGSGWEEPSSDPVSDPVSEGREGEDEAAPSRATPKAALVKRRKTKKLPVNAKPSRVLPYGIDIKGDGSFVKQVR